MGNKILIIEKDERDIKLMKRYLNKAGFRNIIAVESGEAGVNVAKYERPDIVIIDTLLSGMDGFETCRKIREEKDAGTARIIMMTGFVDAVDAVKARKMGADDYCVKTSDCSHLIKVMKRHI